ncbi:hypothetical protein APHAL10511_005533 [Amanita phalloides]|nr:hypothetical protein APHAL10511_005533 [Amanita phalloides]
MDKAAHIPTPFLISLIAMLLKNVQTIIKCNAGLLLIVASEGFFVLMSAAVKVLTGSGVPLFEILLVRMIATYICSVAYMFYAKISDPILGPQGVRHLLFCRGIFGFVGTFCTYYSLQYLPLSDAIVLTLLTPLSTAIAGSFLLKEKFTKGEALAGTVSLFGVVLIARPPFIFGAIGIDKSPSGVENEVPATQRMTAVGVVMIGVLATTGAFISIRAAGKRAHPLHNMVYYSFLSTIQSAIGAIIARTPIILPTQPLFLSMLVMIGILGFFAQVLMTMGYQIEAAGRASMGIYSKVIFALILERILLGSAPGLLSILGTVLILASAIYAALAKMKGGHVKLDEDVGEDVEERSMLEEYDECKCNARKATKALEAEYRARESLDMLNVWNRFISTD